jgi:hypothetical protein
MSVPPPRPVKGLPTHEQANAAALSETNMKKLRLMGRNIYNEFTETNNNVEVVNLSNTEMAKLRTHVEHPVSNYKARMVTPKKGKHGMNIFGRYGQLPSEYGRNLKVPGAPVKQAPSERTRRRKRQNRRTRKN